MVCRAMSRSPFLQRVILIKLNLTACRKSMSYVPVLVFVVVIFVRVVDLFVRHGGTLWEMCFKH